MYVDRREYIILKEDIEKLLKYNEINKISVNEDEFITQILKESIIHEKMPLLAIKQAIKEVNNKQIIL